jgi:hypothetical protein
MESERRPTLFTGNSTGGAHITHRSVYPDGSMRETLDQVSPTKYTIHFTQSAGGKTTKSVVFCNEALRATSRCA